MDLKWEDGFVVSVKIIDSTVILSANKEGLKSLANHLNALSEESTDSHIHLDKYNSLEDDSSELIIERIS